MADVTHPLTPREKVAEIVEAAILRHHPSAVISDTLDDASDILTALASGSGDHAELARLAEAAEHDPEYDGRSFEAAANPATVLALLAENAALRAENDVLEVERIGLRAAIFGSHDYDPGLRHGNFIEMARTTEDARRGAVTRATEAERKLAEAVQIMKPFARMADEEGGYREDDRLAWGLNRCDISWGDLRAVRTFISKEAERG